MALGAGEASEAVLAAGPEAALSQAGAQSLDSASSRVHRKQPSSILFSSSSSNRWASFQTLGRHSSKEVHLAAEDAGEGKSHGAAPTPWPSTTLQAARQRHKTQVGIMHPK